MTNIKKIERVNEREKKRIEITLRTFSTSIITPALHKLRKVLDTPNDYWKPITRS